ncbi:MAG: T9SS type A sorting domain-containing protein [Bacteroidota bacterium]
MGMTNGDNTNATFQIGESVASCFSTPLNTVWFKFAGPASGFVDITTDFSQGTNFDTEIAMYAAAPGGGCATPNSLVEVACADGGGIVNPSNGVILSQVAPAGDTFYVQVQGFAGTQGTFCIEVHEAAVLPPPGPSNDTLCNAIPLVLSDTCSGPNGDNTNASAQIGEAAASCFVGGSQSVWFSFVAPTSGLVNVSTDFAIGSNDDTEIAVYDLPGGDCTNPFDLVEIACDQDGGTVVGFNSVLTGVALTPGNTYYVAVSGWDGTQGDFCLDVEEIILGTNDSACLASPLLVDGIVAGPFSNIGATVTATEDADLNVMTTTTGTNDGWICGGAFCDTTIQASVWFTFTAPASGALNIDLCSQGNTDFDTQIALFETTDCSDFSSYVWVAGNDDTPGGCPVGNLFASSMDVFCLTPGNTYYLLVDGFGAGEEGSFDVTLTELTVPAVSATVDRTEAPGCPGEATGSASLVVSGGSPPFTFAWSNNTTDPDLINVVAGTYTYTITDNCDSTFTGSVTVPPAPSLTAFDAPDVTTCGTDGVQIGLDVPASSGTPRASERAFGIDVGAGSFIRHKLNDAANFTVAIPSGIGSAFAGDFVQGFFLALDNDAQTLLLIDPTSNTVSTLGSSIPLAGHTWGGLAFDENSGILYGLSLDGAASQLYTIDQGAGTATPTVAVGLPFAIWLAIDENGNAYTADISDDTLYSLDLSTGVTTPIGPLGIDLNFGQDADFDPETNELYTMAIGGAFGGTSQLFSIDVSTGAASFVTAYGGGAQIGGWAIAEETIDPYLVSWNPPVGLTNPTISNPIASPTTDTEYVITIIDDCGTFVTDTVMVTVGDGLNIAAEATSDDGSGTAGSASVDINTGTPPYTFAWSNGGTTQSISGLAPGVYTVSVTDANGCTAEDSTTVGAVSIDDLLNAGINMLEAYPNPNQGSFTLSVEFAQVEDVEIAVYDISGKAVYRQSENGVSKVSREINLQSSASGIYMLRVRTENGEAYRRIVVQ